jgi:receptor protein-tyrosine kinase
VSAPPYTESPAAGSDEDPGSDSDFNEVLSKRFSLSSESTQEIYDLMRTANLSFTEAAVRLGLMTREQIDDSQAASQPKKDSKEAGLIETAIRRIASDRQLVLRQGEKVKPGPQLILAHDADNPRSEKIRALRTELLLLSETSTGAHMIALLSACPGEGRSQLAAELAICFSQLGRRALLVDADLRRPKQHLLFGSTNETGLADAIARNQNPLFHPVEGLPQLSLLTSGSMPPNPLELLSDGRFRRLLEDWRKSYEFVVLDTPPIRNYADGLAIATLAERVLVLSRAQHTSFKDTRALLRRLASTRSQVVGAVINHF